MFTLNTVAKAVLEVIVADCDDLDGWGFTRTDTIIEALMVTDDPKDASMALRALVEADIVSVDMVEDEVWVRPEAFAFAC